jgi:hypothetical protein
MSAESDYISAESANILRTTTLIRNLLEGKSFEQQLEYWQKRTGQLKELQKQAKEKK